jgi:hypothetical protein
MGNISGMTFDKDHYLRQYRRRRSSTGKQTMDLLTKGIELQRED